MKILVSKNITLDLFCKNPIKILKEFDNKAIAVLQNDTTIFYAINPDFLKKIFDIEYNSVYTHSEKENINKKFSMHPKWTPDKDFIRQAALWGIILDKEVLESELACFISYWQAEGCFFYHIQWQQKLARSLQKSRSLTDQFSKKRRDITYIPTPDQTIPSGFRGK
ncbi:primosomal protein DnaT [Buchnera aphidicola]|uniref:Replication restart protein DnaT n=1 Tax=Buchnera aphidicola str. USDA (Myzus persicae) TaxID=1009856 RepID=W0P4F5_BUCMP|nr:primosomal protein DnaT [Buchnera aphidicola]AHG60337.1 Dnat [Buchnera aphidicola str. USDA (Myzus persicae)]AHG60915.1 Dnat [Buchnera aphidicola str. W106 (Myzus persicae)]AHG61487.1 Dnat [Buchnera aphidicola str. G002 (Myzus persicae)]AHG62060.1 Dnat [Buchnera aphidicola str. F009 (Myzus persicae)]WAI02976.1 MAG: primosomal protein DnaT [Buchnera aphidicola (Myzus persicae)]